MNIKQLKEDLGLKNKDLAEFLDMKPSVYANSSEKKRYERALCLFYAHVLTSGKKR